MSHPLWIVIEGADGAGKTRFAAALQREISACGGEVSLVHTPSLLLSGRIALAAIGRSALGDHRWSDLPHSNTPTYARALYFLADMAAVFEQIIEPALQGGQIVISDRWLPSTLIYHRAVLEKGGMGDRSTEFSVRALSNFYESYHFLNPSCHLIVDAPLGVRMRRLDAKHELARAQDADWKPDWYEAQPPSFHRGIGEQFRETAIDRGWPIVDGWGDSTGVTLQSEAMRIVEHLNRTHPHWAAPNAT